MADTFRVSIANEKIKRALLGLMACVANPRPVLKVIGERMLRHTEKSFTKETSPEGKKWKAVGEKTAARKRNPKILTEQGEAGGLRGTLAYSLEGMDALLVGANKPYARIHQLGGEAGRNKAVKIPARPYLGISAEAEADILDVISRAIKKSLDG